MPDHPSALRPVFVYGTLRAGGSNDINRHRPAPVALGRAEISGRLFDLGAYPGAVLGGATRIVGEVYAVTVDVERALDRLEEVRDDDEGEYRRRVVQVHVPEHGAVDCLVYEIHPDRIVAAPVIDSGDWFLR